MIPAFTPAFIDILFALSIKSGDYGLPQGRLSSLVNIFPDGQFDAIHPVHQGTELAWLDILRMLPRLLGLPRTGRRRIGHWRKVRRAV